MTVSLHPHSSWPHVVQAVELNDSALVCHLAFWKPLSPSDSPSQRLLVINEILRGIYRKCGQSFTNVLGSRNPSCVLNLSWEGLPVTLQFLLHEELVSLTIYIHAAAETSTDVADLVLEYVENLSNSIDTACPCPEPETCHEFMFDTIWQRFFNDHPALPNPSSSWGESLPEGVANPHVVTNSRGLLLICKSKKQLEKESIDLLNTFINCGTSGAIDMLSICHMKHNRALHLCALADTPSRPQFYMLVVCSDLAAQDVGDLVFTGHRLLVNRFAAVSTRDILADADHCLRQVENDIHLAHDAISIDAPPETIDDIVRGIKKKLFDDFNKLFIGGGRYRLRKCASYKAAFDGLIAKLDITSVENFVTYAEGAGGILVPLTRRIESILNSHDEIVQRFYNLMQMVNSKVTAENSEETATRNKKIAELLETTELFLFFALVPYYLGHAFSETYHAVIDHEHINHTADMLIWSGVAAFGGWLTLHSLAKHRGEKPLGKIASKIIQIMRVPASLLKDPYFLFPIAFLSLAILFMVAVTRGAI